MDPSAGGGGASPAVDDTVVCNVAKEPIRDVIESHGSEIEDCRELIGGGGEVVVGFVIEEDGSVSEARVRSSTSTDPALESCITGAVSSWSFGSTRGCPFIVVSYPFDLR
jgi:outer membrane biosynthesis protein TonB